VSIESANSGARLMNSQNAAPATIPTRPGYGEGGEQDRVGEIDGEDVGKLPVHAEQRDRARPQQVRRPPPRHGGDLRVLHPGEQQQQAEDGLDVNGHQEQRVDVESHQSAPQVPSRTPTSVGTSKPGTVSASGGKNG
jgi:hypothetical protein